MFHATLLYLLPPPCRKLLSSLSGTLSGLPRLHNPANRSTSERCEFLWNTTVRNATEFISLSAFTRGMSTLYRRSAVAERAWHYKRASAALQPRLTFLSPFSRRYIFARLRNQCKRVHKEVRRCITGDQLPAVWKLNHSVSINPLFHIRSFIILILMWRWKHTRTVVFKRSPS